MHLQYSCFLMNGVFRKYLDKFLIVILDGILIYSKTKEEHEEHLTLVMQVLRKCQLYAKLSKCSFYQGRIHYLGHIIYEEGVSIDPKKIRAIMEWLTPRNVSEVRYFMGLARYYLDSSKDSQIYLMLSYLCRRRV